MRGVLCKEPMQQGCARAGQPNDEPGVLYRLRTDAGVLTEDPLKSKAIRDALNNFAPSLEPLNRRHSIVSAGTAKDLQRLAKFRTRIAKSTDLLSRTNRLARTQREAGRRPQTIKPSDDAVRESYRTTHLSLAVNHSVARRADVSGPDSRSSLPSGVCREKRVHEKGLFRRHSTVSADLID